MKKRSLLQALVCNTAAPIFCFTTSALSADKQIPIKEDWFTELFAKRRSSDSQLLFGRFRDARYFLLAPITWKPNHDQVSKYQGVTVPMGFVSDLATIPSSFFRILPPDAEYAYSAIIHDYLYWIQDRPRVVADDIFKMAMQDFAVSTWKIQTL